MGQNWEYAQLWSDRPKRTARSINLTQTQYPSLPSHERVTRSYPDI